MDSLIVELKPENIFELSRLQFSSNEDYSAFYARFRGAVSNRLKKAGTTLTYLGELQPLLEDEIISPTFEEVIIIWCLEKIDKRLPNLTNQAFGHKLADNITLKDLQHEIFKQIPEILKEGCKEENKIKAETLDDESGYNEENGFMDYMSPQLFEIEGELTSSFGKEEKEVPEDLDDINDDAFNDIDYAEENSKKKRIKKEKASNENLCEECDKYFPTKKKFMEHIKIHKVDPYDCEICDKTLPNMTILSEHVRRQHKVTFACKLCGQVLKNQALYERHKKDSHKNKYTGLHTQKIKKHRHVCRYCLEPQADHQALKAHTFKHKIAKEIDFIGGNMEDEELAALVDEVERMKADVKEENGVGEIKNGFVDDDADHIDNDDDLKNDEDYDAKHDGVSETESGAEDYEPTQCEFCNNTYSASKIKRHITKQHKAAFKCYLCESWQATLKMYDDHLKEEHAAQINIHYDEKVKTLNHVCRLCLEPQPSHQDLRTHMLHHRDNDQISFVKEKFTKRKVKVKKTVEKEQICDICGKTVKFMKRHMSSAHEFVEKMFCQICDITFIDEKSSRIHMKWHKHQEKNAFCEECGKGFSCRESLKKHKKLHDIGGEKLRCETCKRTFYSKYEMGSHVCKHYACELCGEKFLRARNLEFHKRMHMGESLFSCDQCESMFLKKKRLSDHMRTVHQKKKYQCDVCEKFFQSKSNLNKHRLNHTGERKFKCDVCGLNYARKSILDRHMMLHTGEMPYSCGVCSVKFRTTGELKFHREFKKCGFTDKDFYSM